MRPLFIVLFGLFSASSASLGTDPLPKAKNVTWISHNFKTILTWAPKPIHHTYTVEFSRVGRDRRTNVHCIQSVETECDLTKDLRDFRASYTADILSELSPQKHGSDLVEPPFSMSKKFCPYNDTLIGKPEFSIKLMENKTVVLYIQDQLTALYSDHKQLTIRDVFNTDLKYKILYRKAGSTGTVSKHHPVTTQRQASDTFTQSHADWCLYSLQLYVCVLQREVVVDGDVVVMAELDEGESYCFTVAAFLPKRKGTKRLGRWSLYKCSPAEGSSSISEYRLELVGSVLLGVLTLVLILIIVIIACCKRVNKENQMKHSEDISQV
ncbi:tissue factor-like isoform X1 [Hoplias malabaricus]|uniref:tissue factor-like isoform X1 n=1 Tax=Hoplias malabaricus TaxID=27720 RepID=UPI003462E46A